MPWDRKRLLGHVETIQLILGVTDTLPPIYLSLSNSRWKRIENARKTHYVSNANFENPIKAHYPYALNCSATHLPVNQSITQV